MKTDKANPIVPLPVNPSRGPLPIRRRLVTVPVRPIASAFVLSIFAIKQWVCCRPTAPRITLFVSLTVTKNERFLVSNPMYLRSFLPLRSFPPHAQNNVSFG